MATGKRFRGKDIPQLHAHQRDAVAMTLKYLKGWNSGAADLAALAQMPTGTGKTGIVAVLARDCSTIRRTLVLAPRVAIRDHLIRHIESHFFSKINHPVKPRCVTLLTKEAIRDVSSKNTEFVFVATIQQVDRLRKDDLDAYRALGKLLDLVIMDEGHYEPAPSWNLTIRGLGKPVLLLTATPYRNDLKSFRIDEAAIATLRFDDAVNKNIIRDVEFVDRPGKAHPLEFAKDVIAEFERLIPSIEERSGARIIVRCESKQNIENICDAFDSLGYNPLGIHEGFSDSDLNKGRCKSVPHSAPADSKVWVHQFKLLEGVDDPSFRLVAFFDALGSSRSLVQQVGRVLRNPGQQPMKAYVLDHHLSSHIKQWEKFQDFDRLVSKSTLSSPLAKKVADALMTGMAELEYVDRTVRRRFALPNVVDPSTEFQVRKEVYLFRKSETSILPRLMSWIDSQLSEQDCIFKAFSIDANTQVVAYIQVGNSPLLADTYFLEPSLELIVTREYAGMIAYFDSGGTVPFNEHTVGIEGVVHSKNLRRLINGTSSSRVSALSTRNTSAAASTIRTRSVTAASLEDSATFFDDFQHAITSITGYSDEGARTRAANPSLTNFEARRRQLEVRRYIGFVRGRLSEAGPRVLLHEYLGWLDEVSSILENSRRKALPLYARFSTELSRAPTNASPRNILIDFEEASEIFSTFNVESLHDEKALEVEDSCQDCSPANDVAGAWQFELNANGVQYPVRVRFDSARQNYFLESDRMRKSYRPRSRRVREDVIAFINRRQLFSVVTETPKVVYLQGSFFESDVPHGLGFEKDKFHVGKILEPLNELRLASSEKGDTCLPGNAGWQAGSLFSLIDGIPYSGLVADVADVESLVCDDLHREVADFILCDQKGRRVAAIHAKASSKWSPLSASNIQEVCAQAMKNVGFLSMFAPVKPPNLVRWDGPWGGAKNVKGTVSNRIRHGPTPGASHWAHLEARIRDPNTKREVWLFLGNMLSKSALEVELAKKTPRAESFHTVHLLQTAMATISSMGATLRVFCSP